MIMCKPRLIVGPVIGLVLVLSGCGLFSGPSRTTKDFYRHLESGNLDKAMTLVSSRVKNGMGVDKLRVGLGQATRAIKQHGGIDSIDITREEITGEIADVLGTIKYKDGTIENLTEKLVKENGDWKLEPK
jgi:hypothetical protein